jgi:hypothetical protein
MRLTGHDYVIEAFATSWPDEPLDALGGSTHSTSGASSAWLSGSDDRD